jgi:hypothetical protein
MEMTIKYENVDGSLQKEIEVLREKIQEKNG